MKIWVDADACPKVIKEILFRAAIRLNIPLVLVANQYFQFPISVFISFMQVPFGFDVADNKIVEEIKEGDLVITADIPLASLVINKNATALNPRGELYSTSNIKQRLAMRNFNEELRSAGIMSGGPAKLSAKDSQAFANQLDKILSKYKQSNVNK